VPAEAIRPAQPALQFSPFDRGSRMTSKEWRRCRDPITMIAGLKGVTGERKGRLYLCGGCRMIWHLLYHDPSRRAVEVAERFVDGQATREELGYAHWTAEVPTFGFDFEPGRWRKRYPEDPVLEGTLRLVEMGVLRPEQLEEDEPEVDETVRDRLLAAASLAYVATSRSPFDHDWWHRYIPRVPWPGDWLLRCVFGNPFLPFIFFSPAWLTPSVVFLAGTIYEERAFDRMPMLAEALRGAGCMNQDMIDHCQSREPHVRGCWVLDVVLGKAR
jgi:hypothetical protein